MSGTAGPAPVRRAGSVRRTATLDMSWPDGLGTPLRIEGRARDVVTGSVGGDPVVVDEASVVTTISPERTIASLEVTPPIAHRQALIGTRIGGTLRTALADHVPEEKATGAPSYLLLDDLGGGSLIAGFVYSRWMKDLIAQARENPDPDRPRPQMEGICIGFRPGARSLRPDGTPEWDHRVAEVGSLINPYDPDGWHEMPEPAEVSMQRARRIDLWNEGDEIVIDAAFRDSATDPDVGRVAVHEYRIHAQATTDGVLAEVRADPRVLPYLECPDAADKVHQVVGTPLADLREVVLDRLAKTEGCTHLNDAVRAFAEVPALLRHLT